MVPGRVGEEHRRLFARLSTKTNVGSDDEEGSGGGEPGRERFPFLPAEHDAKVRDRDLTAIHRRQGRHLHRPRRHMRADLVAEEVEVDPPLGLAPDGTSENVLVESTRRLEIGDGKREMEWPHVRRF